MGAVRFPLLAVAMTTVLAACVRERVVYVVKEVPGPAASCSCVEATCPPPAPTSRTCGQLRLHREALRAYGKGDRHPDVLAVEAKLAECKDSTPTPAECSAVRAELVELEKGGHGPMHPDVRAKRAELSVCP
jgi:hypothetical protein